MTGFISPGSLQHPQAPNPAQQAAFHAAVATALEETQQEAPTEEESALIKLTPPPPEAPTRGQMPAPVQSRIYTAPELTLQETNYHPPLTEDSLRYFEITGTYAAPDSTEQRICMVKPEGFSRGNGMTTAAFMMMHTLHARNETINWKNTFWQWVINDFNQDSMGPLRKCLEENITLPDDFRVHGLYFQAADILEGVTKDADCTYLPITDWREDLMKKLIHMPRPFMVTLTNTQQGKGKESWVVVDEITPDSRVFLRSPYEGKAFEMTLLEFTRFWKQNKPVQAICITDQPLYDNLQPQGTSSRKRGRSGGEKSRQLKFLRV